MIVSAPAGGLGVGELVGEAGCGDRDVQRAVLGRGGALGLRRADGGQQARVLARLGDRLRDVGGDVARVVALDELGGHQRQRLARP